jgi:hypothetical protein
MSRGCGAGQNQAEEDYQAGICRGIAEHHSSFPEPGAGALKNL